MAKAVEPGAELKIMFIHEVNYLDKPIFEMHEYPEAFAGVGHEVHFVHFPEGWSMTRILRSPRKKLIKGLVKANSQITLHTPVTLGGGFIGRMSLALIGFFQLGATLLLNRPDIIFNYAVPTNGWQVIILSKMLRIPVLHRSIDSSTEIRTTAFRKLVSIAEKFVLKNADWNSANNRALRDQNIVRGAAANRTSVDLPPLNLPTASKDEDSEFRLRQKLGIRDDSFVILYLGSFFYFSGLDEVVKEFANRSGGSDVLVLVGFGEKDRELRQLAHKLGVENRVIFTGRVEFSRIADYLKIADVAINPLVPGSAAELALPNKVLQYMSCELAVVSTNVAGLRQTFESWNAGIIFCESPRAVIVSALNLSKYPDKLREMGRINKKSVDDMFKPGNTIGRMETLVRTVSKGDYKS